VSRSYKKVSCFKDTSRYYKRLVHKRNRMLEREGDYRTGKRYKYTVGRYDVCDWVFLIKPDSPWYERGKRK